MKLVLVLDNIRSAHNVGSIFRTADGLGIAEIICCGITPYPVTPNDARLPHIRDKAALAIAKTALGAETTVPFRYFNDTSQAISALQAERLHIYALEQAPTSKTLNDFQPYFPAALIVGHEVNGLSQAILNQAEAILEIPMQGNKESLNVAIAAGIAAYMLLNHP